MRNFLLVYNPVSGSGNFKRKLDEFIEEFQRLNILLTVYRTRAGDTGENFVDSIKISGAEGIIISGGDGTLHNVVNWIMNFKINLPIAIIDSGTSNDFATHLNIDNIFNVVSKRDIRPVDAGLVNGKYYFINVASAGVFTAIAHELDSRYKNSLGKFAYYIKGIGELPNFKTVPLTIRADGKNFELEAFLFLVLNSPAVAGFKRITDTTKIDDGKLDILALKKCTPRQLINLAQKIFSGKCVENDANVFYLQAESIEIYSEANLISDLDGEIGDALPLKISAVKGALNFFVNQ